MIEAEKETNSPEESTAGDDAGHSKGSMSKDKECQYCHQAFTSSSLGRHLDQYLFKKKPDGIHDVDEIRRIRSGITRRQARTSSKRDSPEVGGKGYDSTGGSAHDPVARPREGPRFLFNTPTWHSTGVINNIPDHSSQDATVASRPPPFQSRAVSNGPVDSTIRAATSKDTDTIRALELALREVLDNIKAATATTSSRLSPFEFDVQAQTYPSLVLKMLPSPPTLFSSHPFPTTASFPLEPPGVGQVEVVRHALRTQIEQWRNEQLSVSSTTMAGPRGSSTFQDPSLINRTAQQHEEMSSRHLDLAYQNWMILPTDVKSDSWRLEIARAFSRELEKRKEAETQLARVQQEANQLRAQVERLGSCQWPREFALFPPDMLPLSRDAARELGARNSESVGPSASRWDYDQLLAKWKRVVFHDKSMGRIGLGTFGENDEPTSDSTYRSRGNALSPESNTASSSFAQVPPNSSGTSGQQTATYGSYDAHQVKRQRLMNGVGKDSHGISDSKGYRGSPQNTNGNPTTWSPNSVQSLLSNNPAPPTSAPTHRYGGS